MNCKCDSKLVEGPDKNENTISYMMVTDQRKKHSSLLGQESCSWHFYFFFFGENCCEGIELIFFSAP